MNRARFGTTLSFIDFAFNLIIALVALFLLSIMMLNPPKQESSTKKEAKYLVVMRWQDGSNHDVDLWIQYGERIVGFPMRQAEHLALERDDLGPDDTTQMLHFTPINEEIVAIRAFREGWYTVAAHWYRQRDNSPAPIVRWAIIAVYDNNKIVDQGTVTLTQQGQELTLVRFFMRADGELNYFDSKTQYPFLFGAR